LHSDHIVHLYQIGDHSSADGSHVLYLVMPLLKGQSLEERLQLAGPLSLAELVQVSREAALGLATAHQADIVHRDIKPANIWLETLRAAARVWGTLPDRLSRQAAGLWPRPPPQR
jgi:serine/threonine protein kinase